MQAGGWAVSRGWQRLGGHLEGLRRAVLATSGFPLPFSMIAAGQQHVPGKARARPWSATGWSGPVRRTWPCVWPRSPLHAGPGRAWTGPSQRPPALPARRGSRRTRRRRALRRSGGGSARARSRRSVLRWSPAGLEVCTERPVGPAPEHDGDGYGQHCGHQERARAVSHIALGASPSPFPDVDPLRAPRQTV
jgi:hypothetical protein